jgi:phage terminase small subunit
MSGIPATVGGGLHKRRMRFAREYCRNGMRGTPAAIAAGYSPKAAPTRAWTLLKNEDVRKEIKRLSAKAFGNSEMGAVETLARISRIARSDIRQLVDDDGRYLRPEEMDDDAAACVAGIEVEVDDDGNTIRKVKLRDPMPALAAMAKYHRVIEDNAAPVLSATALNPQEMIELARRTAFMLARANAMVVEPKESPQTASNGPRIDDLVLG